MINIIKIAMIMITKMMIINYDHDCDHDDNNEGSTCTDWLMIKVIIDTNKNYVTNEGIDCTDDLWIKWWWWSYHL